MSKSNDSFSVFSNTLLVERKYFQTSIVWQIISFYKRVKRRGDTIISPLFQCSDASWQLTLYPFGEKESSPEYYADLYLHNVALNDTSSKHNFTTYLKINIYSGEKFFFKNVSEKCIFQSGASHKFTFATHTLCRRNSYIASDMTISFEICVEDNNFPVAPLGEPTKLIKDEKKKQLCLGCASSSLTTDFEKLYGNPQNSDVTLKLGEVEFQAHKLVLSARSPVFQAMFEHDMQENRLDVVDLVQMEVGTVPDMLRHIYCGKVRELSPEEALNLYVAADRYDLAELKAFCRGRMLNDLSIDNVCDIAAVADLHNDEMVITALKAFISENGKEIIKTEKWKEHFTKKPLLCAKMLEWSYST